jgi:Ca2+ transporting ATPase
MESAWTHSVSEVLSQLKVDQKKGLSEQEVEKRREEYGSNKLEEGESTPLWKLILAQFQDQLVLILLASAVISFILALLEAHESLLTALIEPGVIFLILIANATVGVIQERNADQAIEALKEYSPDSARVVRSGHSATIRAEDLVPGDIVSISVGDKVPADCRLISIKSSSFRVDQAILTGESTSVRKDVGIVADPRAVKQDMTNILFSGTTIATGSGLAVIVLTGSKTAIGHIHKAISDEEDEKTPLKQKLDDFGDMLAKVITVICILVWLINFRHFSDPSHGGLLKGAIYYFKIAVALAVAAIPEGLAAVITACLALGTKKMAKKNAIVRHLPSVETLGSTNVICSDKTGTLTTNQMSITRFSTMGSSQSSLEDYHVEGTSFSPIGGISSSNGKQLSGLNSEGSAVNALVEVCAVCNDSKISIDKAGNYAAVGQPTEAALKVLVEKIQHHSSEVNGKLSSLSPEDRATAVSDSYEEQYERLLTLEFTRERKSMSTLVKRTDGKGALFVKGAPDTMLDRCSQVKLGNGQSVAMSSKLRESLQERVHEYGSRGLRVLALAVVEDAALDTAQYQSDSSTDYARFEQEMTFVGLVGMMDPPRPEVKGAIQKCRSAGIRVIVITGDNKDTAETICKEIGIFDQNEDLTGKSFTGREFDELSQADKVKAVLNASLFSRTEPTHKYQLVELLQQQKLVVAMTGDGVNDAPALKKADIGIAMGQSGTDVAKLAADMVLADDNFATIEVAVEEGRSIFNNTQSFIRYLISSNIGEVVSIFLTVLLGMPEALIPVQLLWVNLVTDGLPATALGFNPPDHEIMMHKPRRRDEPLVGKWLFFRYMIVGVYVGFATVGGYAWWFMYYSGGPQISFYHLTHFHQCADQFSNVIDCRMFTNDMAKAATSVSLSILVVIEMLNALNALSEVDSLLIQPPTKNPFLIFAILLSLGLHFMILYVPFLRDLFVVTPLNVQEWKGVMLFSAPVIVIDEVCKWITRNYINPPDAPGYLLESTGKSNGHATNGSATHATEKKRN